MNEIQIFVLCLILLILAGRMTVIAADDDYESLGDYTFDIPNGYNVTDKADETVAMGRWKSINNGL